MRVIPPLAALLLLLGCASPPAATAPGDPLRVRAHLRCHPSLGEREGGPILQGALPILRRFVEEVALDPDDFSAESPRPLVVALLDRAPGPPERWNLRLYTPSGELIFEETAWPEGGEGGEGPEGREAAALEEIGSALARSDRAREYALHRSVYPPEVLLRHREDSIFGPE